MSRRARHGRGGILWTSLIVFGCGLGCERGAGHPPAEREAAQAARPTPLPVTRGALEDRMVLSGEIEAATAEKLSVPQLPAGGTLSIAWLAEDGAAVKQGDKLVELDASSFMSALEDKRAAVTNAENELDSDVAAASLDVAAKEFDVEKARAELAKAELKASVPAELAPRRDFQQGQLDREAARDKLTAASEALAARRRQAALDRTVKEVKKTRAERELADLMKRLEDLNLRAPRDGVVQLATNYREGRKYIIGDQVYPGWSLVSLPDLSSMQVRARLSDVDDGTVAEGMAADCILDAYPRKAWRGRLIKVSPAAHAEKSESSRRFFDVLVALDGATAELMRPGMSVRVEVIRRRAEDALIVPRAALRSWPGKSEVRLASGATQTVEVDFCAELACVVRGGILDGNQLLPQTAGRGQP